MNKYKVTLTAEERLELEGLIAAGKAAAKKLMHARILLKADAAAGGPAWPDGRIAEAVEVSAATIGRVRQRFVEEGLEAALVRKKQDRPSRERKLEIMRDSRIGTYGACALALSLLLRVGALASLAGPGPVALALIAAHAGARAMLPLFLRLVPPARPDGLSAGAGRPTLSNAAAALLPGFVFLLVSFGIARSVVAFLLLLAGLAVMRWLCLRQIGGQTGDAAGAFEQVGEIVILLTAVAVRV